MSYSYFEISRWLAQRYISVIRLQNRSLLTQLALTDEQLLAWLSNLIYMTVTGFSVEFRINFRKSKLAPLKKPAPSKLAQRISRYLITNRLLGFWYLLHQAQPSMALPTEWSSFSSKTKRQVLQLYELTTKLLIADLESARLIDHHTLKRVQESSLPKGRN